MVKYKEDDDEDNYLFFFAIACIFLLFMVVIAYKHELDVTDSFCKNLDYERSDSEKTTTKNIYCCKYENNIEECSKIKRNKGDEK